MNAVSSCSTAWKSSCSREQRFFPSCVYEIKFISYLCNQIDMCRAQSFLLHLLRAFAVLLVKYEAFRFCLVYRIWKIQKHARRSATVHVIRGLVVSCSSCKVFPEPGTETWDTQAHFFMPVPERQERKPRDIKLHRISSPEKATLSGDHATNLTWRCS